MDEQAAKYPRYRSHKIVEAFKIGHISPRDNDQGAALIPENGLIAMCVDQAYVEKHQPKVGGYYVRYLDGYESWSPAQAFEEGYTLVGESEADAGPGDLPVTVLQPNAALRFKCLEMLMRSRDGQPIEAVLRQADSLVRFVETGETEEGPRFVKKGESEEAKRS